MNYFSHKICWVSERKVVRSFLFKNTLNVVALGTLEVVDSEIRETVLLITSVGFREEE